ncbi:hypothetical protein [Verminephrobacter eiseniae]|nr:hypothetical protein [Verminephrobacter eiseniae]
MIRYDQKRTKMNVIENQEGLLRRHAAGLESSQGLGGYKERHA